MLEVTGPHTEDTRALPTVRLLISIAMLRKEGFQDYLGMLQNVGFSKEPCLHT